MVVCNWDPPSIYQSRTRRLRYSFLQKVPREAVSSSPRTLLVGCSDGSDPPLV